MPSPQAVVTFVTVLLVLLVALHVPLALPAVPSASAAFLLALGCAWIVHRNVPDEDDDVTEEARVAAEGSQSQGSHAPDPEPAEPSATTGPDSPDSGNEET